MQRYFQPLNHIAPHECRVQVVMLWRWGKETRCVRPCLFLTDGLSRYVETSPDCMYFGRGSRQIPPFRYPFFSFFFFFHRSLSGEQQALLSWMISRLLGDCRHIGQASLSRDLAGDTTNTCLSFAPRVFTSPCCSTLIPVSTERYFQMGPAGDSILKQLHTRTRLSGIQRHVDGRGFFVSASLLHSRSISTFVVPSHCHKSTLSACQ